MSKTTSRWLTFLDPDVLRPQLISASIFIAAFEMLQESIIGRVRSYYTDPFEDTPADNYRQEVLALDPKGKERPLQSSLEWLKAHEALDDTDLTALTAVTDVRNQLAHELTKVVGGTSTVDYSVHFPTLVSLLRKIEVWWILNFEIPLNSDLDGKEIDYDGIVPGPVLILQVMMIVALGEPEEARFYLDGLRAKQASA